MGRPERWVVRGSGFFTAFRMTEGRGVCHSEEQSDEESQGIARLLRIHPDKRDLQSVCTGATVVCRDYSAAAILSQWNRASPKRAWFTLALLWYRWMSISLVKDIPPWHWCARYVTLP